MPPTPDQTDTSIITIAIGASSGFFRVLDRVFEAKPVTPRETLPIQGLIDGTSMPTAAESRETMRAILNARRVREIKGQGLKPGGPEITDDWMLDIPGVDVFRLLAFLTNPARATLPTNPDELGGDLPN